MDTDDESTPPSLIRGPALTQVKSVDHLHSLDVDPLLATATTLSPPLSPIDDAGGQLRTNATARIPKILSRRQIQLSQRPRGDSTASTQSPPPLTPSPSDAEEDMDFSDADSEMAEDDDQPTPRLLLHARIYSAAEKYGIPGLKALAQLKFQTRLFPPTLEAYNASPLGSSEEARHLFLADEFPEAIHEVYRGTIDGDRGLRNAVCQAFRMHAEWGRVKEITEVIQENGRLGWDLYRLSTGMPLQ